MTLDPESEEAQRYYAMVVVFQAKNEEEAGLAARGNEQFGRQLHIGSPWRVHPLPDTREREERFPSPEFETDSCIGQRRPLPE